MGPWLEYYKSLLFTEEGREEQPINRQQKGIHPLEIEELKKELGKTKHRKATGDNNINSKLFTCLPEEIKSRF